MSSLHWKYMRVKFSLFSNSVQSFILHENSPTSNNILLKNGVEKLCMIFQGFDP